MNKLSFTIIVFFASIIISNVTYANGTATLLLRSGIALSASAKLIPNPATFIISSAAGVGLQLLLSNSDEPGYDGTEIIGEIIDGEIDIDELEDHVPETKKLESGIEVNENPLNALETINDLIDEIDLVLPEVEDEDAANALKKFRELLIDRGIEFDNKLRAKFGRFSNPEINNTLERSREASRRFNEKIHGNSNAFEFNKNIDQQTRSKEASHEHSFDFQENPPDAFMR